MAYRTRPSAGERRGPAPMTVADESYSPYTEDNSHPVFGYKFVAILEAQMLVGLTGSVAVEAKTSVNRIRFGRNYRIHGKNIESNR